MTDRKVQIDILANEKGFTKGVGAASKSASTLENALKKLGPVGSVIQSLFDKLGISSITSAAGIAGGITAAVGASAVIVEKAIKQYSDLGEKIRSYSIITGESSEVASRQVRAFQELGVSEEAAATGMGKLAREANNAPAKLKAVGVEVVRDSNGNLDLNATLLKVVDAYQGTTDAGRRAAIVFAAFGKAGAAMIPILETNAAQLKRLEEQVGMVYTEADLNRVRKYQIAQQELQRNQDEMGLNLGQLFLPAHAAVIQTMNEEAYVQKRLAEAYADGTLKANAVGRGVSNLEGKFRDEYRAAQDAQTQIDTLTQAHKDAADAAQAEADAEDTLSDELHKSLDAGFAYKQSLLDLKKAHDDVAKAKGKDAESNLRLREAYVRVADAAVTLAEDQAAANGVTLSASEKADIWRAKLRDLEKGLAPNSPLRKDIEGYIAQLNSIPAEIHTNVSLTTQKFATHKAMSFDEGGVVPGPTGAAVAAIVHGGEAVLTPAQQARLRSAGPATKVEQHFHFNIEGYYSDGAGLDRLANALARRLSSVTGR